MQLGDIIHEMNGEPITSYRGPRRALFGSKPGDRHPFRLVEREGRQREFAEFRSAIRRER